jgi:hypothetical protein
MNTLSLTNPVCNSNYLSMWPKISNLSEFHYYFQATTQAKSGLLVLVLATVPDRHVGSGSRLEPNRRQIRGPGSVSNGSSFGPGRFYRSAWQRPYPIKNRRLFKRTIALWLQILIREFSIWYIQYVASYGASFGRLRFSISSNLSKQ